MTERRHEARVEALNLVSVEEFNEAGFRTDLSLGRTLDLSHDGMRLELSHPVPLRSVVSLHLALGETVIDVHGRVQFLRDLDGDGCELGLQFVDMSPEQWEDLDAYLKLHGLEETPRGA